MARTKPAVEVAVSPPSFEVQALAVASRLRAEMAAIFAALPFPISGGTDLHRQLGLTSTVSWQLHSFVSAANPVSALGYVPGRASMSRLLQAAKQQGLDDDLLGRLDQAYGDFEAFVQAHARDRATLNSLVSGLNGQSGDADAAAVDLKRRRSAYRDNSHLWGIQAETCLRCVIWHPGAAPGTHDGALISGYVGVHPLRRGVPVSLKRRSAAGDNSGKVAPERERLRPATEIRVLEEFSSRPVPELATAPDSLGYVETTLRFGGVGKGAAVNCFVSEVVRNSNQGVPQSSYSTSLLMTVPVETLVDDMLIPRGWADPTTVRTSTHGNPAHVESVYDRRAEFELPVKETASYLGTDLSALQTSDVPRYTEMVRGELERLGWSGTEFDIVRVRVRFPILHSMIHLRIETGPQRPSLRGDGTGSFRRQAT